MRLEMRKYKLGVYIRSALIANLIIFGFLCLISFVEKFEGEAIFTDYATAFLLIDTIVRATFLVFASVLMARIVIGEFNNKLITVLFMYPINRIKLMLSKLIIVVLFTFICMIVSNVLLYAAFYIFDSFADVVPAKLTASLIAQKAVWIPIDAALSSMIALIPLYFGMRKYSSATTIVSSFLLAIVVCQDTNGFSVFTSFISVAVLLAGVGVFLAFLSIRKIEHADVV